MWSGEPDPEPDQPPESNRRKVLTLIVAAVVVVITLVLCCVGIRIAAGLFDVDPRLV